MTRPRPIVRAFLAVGVLAAAWPGAPPASAKTSAASNRTASATTSGAQRTATTRPLARRLAGTPIAGWEHVTRDDLAALGQARVARSVGKSVFVLRDPGGQTQSLRFDATQTIVGDRAFLTLGEQAGYLRVLVPIRPNGTIGWIRATDVKVEPNSLRVVVELSTNTIRVFRNDQVILRELVATGTGNNPTPKGLFFIVDRVPQTNPAGGLGPIVLKLSGFSESLASFAGGQGAIGLHGTSAPGLLGGRVSHGCVRMANSTIARLAALVPLGTSVEVVDRLADRVPDAPLRKAVVERPTVETTAPDAVAPDTTIAAAA